MPARNAEATRTRILDAALAEFADRGFAGGRVDRVARAAETNVRMIYAYFGGKDALFDAALTSAIERMAAAVPPRPADLAAWAGDLFDFHGSDATTLRIALWAQLERPEAAAEPLDDYLAKVSAVTGASPLDAVDVLTFVYSLAQAWYLTPIGLLSADGRDPRDPARVAAHREALVAAVHRLTGK